MYININLAISTKFQEPQWGKLEFPGHLRIEWVVSFWTRGAALLDTSLFARPLARIPSFSWPFKSHSYVRVWQKGDAKLGCDPASHRKLGRALVGAVRMQLTFLRSIATSDYINNHLDLYQNPNYTVFTDSPYTKPKNSLSDTC